MSQSQLVSDGCAGCYLQKLRDCLQAFAPAKKQGAHSPESKFNGQLSKVEALLGELEHPHVLAKEFLFMHKTVAFALLTKCSLIKSVDHPHQVFIGRGQAENLYLAARCNGVLSCAS